MHLHLGLEAGVVAVERLDGAGHVLRHARVEPGLFGGKPTALGVELGYASRRQGHLLGVGQVGAVGVGAYEQRKADVPVGARHGLDGPALLPRVVVAVGLATVEAQLYAGVGQLAHLVGVEVGIGPGLVGRALACGCGQQAAALFALRHAVPDIGHQLGSVRHFGIGLSRIDPEALQLLPELPHLGPAAHDVLHPGVGLGRVVADVEHTEAAQAVQKLRVVVVEDHERVFAHRLNHGCTSCSFLVFTIFCADFDRFSSSSKNRFILRTASLKPGI